jgi:fructose-1,6-bisphosphatase/sedoheptulose 1,7-bisphosphatase-like protein
VGTAWIVNKHRQVGEVAGQVIVGLTKSSIDAVVGIEGGREPCRPARAIRGSGGTLEVTNTDAPVGTARS